MDEVEAAIELLKTTYPDLLQPSAKEAGSALATIVEFLTLPLLKWGVSSRVFEVYSGQPVNGDSRAQVPGKVNSPF